MTHGPVPFRRAFLPLLRVAIGLLVSTAATVPSLAAQIEVRPGSRVRAGLTSGDTVRAELAAPLGGDVLELRVDGEPVRFPTERVTVLQVWREGSRGGGFGKGAGLGFAIGGGIGAIVGGFGGDGSSDDDGTSEGLLDPPPALAAVILGIAFGAPSALIGGILGSAHSGGEWVTVDLPGGDLSPAVTALPGSRIGVGVRWILPRDGD